MMPRTTWKPIAEFSDSELKQAKADNAKMLRLCLAMHTWNCDAVEQFLKLAAEPST